MVTTRESGPTKNGGRPGTVIFATPSLSCGPMIGSWSSPSRNGLPVFAHCACTNSNWRARLACTVMKITPRSAPSSSVTPSGSMSP